MNQYRGVTWHKHRGKYRVRIRTRHIKKPIYLGLFDDIVDAAMVYDCAAVLLHGGNAKINFTGDPPHSIPEGQIVKTLLEYGVPHDQLFLRKDGNLRRISNVY